MPWVDVIIYLIRSGHSLDPLWKETQLVSNEVSRGNAGAGNLSALSCIYH